MAVRQQLGVVQTGSSLIDVAVFIEDLEGLDSSDQLDSYPYDWQPTSWKFGSGRLIVRPCENRHERCIVAGPSVGLVDKLHMLELVSAGIAEIDRTAPCGPIRAVEAGLRAPTVGAGDRRSHQRDGLLRPPPWNHSLEP